MHRNVLVLWVAICVVLSACAVPMPPSEGGASGGMAMASIYGGGAGGAGLARTESIDRQERELQNAFFQRESALVQRDQNNLSVTFQSDVLFGPDSSILLPGAQEEINRVADVLKKYPQSHIVVTGHTDSIGSEEHNLKLSQERARAVKLAMMNHGMADNRIEARGMGESKPIASNATKIGRQLNRRLTLDILPSPG